ncbi:tigger transposable element-derived protein 4 [Plakobranchus ocellatus]|uniref:Tigger transposable element-derived protein 4 n=1 Tax=Plakobranchus ocellatus TaxID=259542 RepID=A0AAV4BSE1_9GAST|nr:tigger transposable element-derived protein 4 [Plakobranchus ocellatus]
MASTSTNVRKRKGFTLEQKIAIIEDTEKKTKTQSKICEEYSIARGSLHTILKDKDKIMSAYTQGLFSQNRKKMRRPETNDVDRALFTWFKDARSKNVPLSGPILVEKAKEFAERLGVTSFTGSTGWLDRFKSRHEIVMKRICGESAAVCQETIEGWKDTQLKKILEEFSPDDIFNADETGLFFKCLPNRTLALKGEQGTGGKIPKERITLKHLNPAQ